VFVRWHKSERPLAEGALAKPTVVPHFFEELVVGVEVLEITRLDGGNHRVMALVDTIVQVTV